MAAKEAIITSKQPRTKADTTSRQAVSMSKKTQHEDKKGKRDGDEVETSEHATVEVMRKVRQLK